MKIPVLRLAPLIIGVTLISASLASHAAMYKWVDEDGSVTYSNTPPVDRSKVKEFTKVEDISTVAADKRPKDAPAAMDRRSTDHASVPSDAAGKSNATSRSEPVRREAEVGRPDATPRAASAPAALQTEAVQDPCLTSADPHCYQRNRDKYHPYLGYAPSARSGGPAPVGASASPAGTGAVGGQIVITPTTEKRAAPSTSPASATRVQTK
jgi:hypothetical protein